MKIKRFNDMELVELGFERQETDEGDSYYYVADFGDLEFITNCSDEFEDGCFEVYISNMECDHKPIRNQRNLRSIIRILVA